MRYRVSRVARRVMGFRSGRPTRTVLVVAAGVMAAGVVVWLWERGPNLAPGTRTGLGASGQVQAVGQYRTTLLQATAAVGGVIALAYTARNYRLSRRGQTTDRFTKALERLGSTDLYVRIGGVYALEQVLRDSPEHHADIVGVLVEFVRAHTRLTASTRVCRNIITHQGTHAVTLSVLPEPLDHPAGPHADVQAALTVLGRLPHRSRPTTRLNLADLHLAGVRLTRANLAGVLLHRTNLTFAQLRGLNLAGADLSEANLTGAWLNDADFTRAWLSNADLTGTWLTRANLTGAHLGEANLTNARLPSANLTDAQLDEANLTDTWLAKANLTGARLDGTNLTGARLGEANLTDARLDGANLTDARLDGANLTGADFRWVKAANQETAAPHTDSLQAHFVWDQILGRVREATAEEIDAAEAKHWKRWRYLHPLSPRWRSKP